MAKKTEIKAGYKLTITSWENDGDHYATESVEGLTREDAAFQLDVVRAYAKVFGNECDRNAADVATATEALKAVFAKHGKTLADVEYAEEDDENEDGSAYTEYASDLCYSFMGASEWYVCRVFESFKMEYFPTTIFIDDVTEEFK
jgi:hypothetical protein